MEARGYRGGEGRTKYRQLNWKIADTAMIVAFSICNCIINFYYVHRWELETMQRYKCIIAYDGTGFSGYQVQPNKRTVQSEIEGSFRKSCIKEVG